MATVRVDGRTVRVKIHPIARTTRVIMRNSNVGTEGAAPTVDSVNGQQGTVVLTKSDVGLGNVDNTSDANKPISTATQTAIDAADADIAAHIADVANPHQVTKAQVGLGNADNTSDVDKPISTATQTALDAKATNTALAAHTDNTSNPHNVTKAQVGLGNVQNLAPADMPVSTDTQTALDAKANASALDAHTSSTANPHNVTKEQVGLGDTDNVQFKQITAGTTTDVLGTALTVIRNNVAVGRIDNNASGLRVQAQSGTLQLRGTGNTGLAIDASGNTVGAGTITATNLSGTNTGDQVLPTWSTISGKPAVVAEGVDAAAARTALSLGDAATKNTGTTAGTLAAGDDSRIGKIGGTVTVSGTPTAGQVPIASSGTAAAWGTPAGGGSAASVAWSGVNVGDHLPVWANGGGGHVSFIMIATRLIPCPLVAVEAMTVDAVSIYVDTGVATSTVDLALYTYNMTTGKPGSFVQHLATIDTSTSGLKTATFAPIALAAGIHVVIGRANTANVTLWGAPGSIGVYRMTSPSGGSNQYTFPHATWVGTVPSWPPSPPWDWNAGVYNPFAAIPKLQLRRSA